jgi:hypothetical protein
MNVRRNVGDTLILRMAVAIGLLLVAAGCGSDSKPDPTRAATTPPGPTVGELADRMAVAWTGVSTFRTVSQNVEEAGTPASASPAGQAPVEVVAEVALPDRKHQVSTSGGSVISEYVLIGDEIFVRGPMTEGAVAGGWSVVDPMTLDPESQQAMQIAALTEPVQPPYAGLSPDERGRVAKPLGAMSVNGQSCQAYQIVDTTQTGERVDVTLAIAASDLPCSIQTQVSGVVYLTTFEFNIPLTITAPIINVSPFQ